MTIIVVLAVAAIVAAIIAYSRGPDSRWHKAALWLFMATLAAFFYYLGERHGKE